LDLAFFVRALSAALPDSLKMIEGIKTSFYIGDSLKMLDGQLSTIVKEFKEKRLGEIRASLEVNPDLEKFEEAFKKTSDIYLQADPDSDIAYRFMLANYCEYIHPKLRKVDDIQMDAFPTDENHKYEEAAGFEGKQ